MLHHEQETRTSVLVVDDQPSVVDAVREWLLAEPGLEIIGHAGDGLTALALAKELQPDVVLIDVKMPAMDGIVTAAALRDAAPQAKVIILTIYDDQATRARARAAGAAAFVAKYASAEALLAAIHQVTGKAPA